jgi:hypothetical protein
MLYKSTGASIPTQLDIVVAASNSAQADKDVALYVCDGTNDEITIQTAVNTARGRVILAEGDYYIDSFPNSEGYGVSSAIHFGASAQQNISVVGAGTGSCRKNGTTNGITGGAIIHVSSACYTGLSGSTQYAIFASVSNGTSRKYPWTKVNIESISFVIPDNQKKIICIDGWMMSSLSIKNVLAMAVADASSASTLKVPVDGCIGIRGMQGSNFGMYNRWESSFVWGFYEGYAVSGEHLVGIDLGSRYCNYGFTFNRKTNGTGAWLHPITLINCCDECNFNMPLFGNNGESGKSDGLSGRQTINLIDFNLEWLSSYYAKGGAYATELYPGFTFGEISYTVQTSYGGNSKNSVSTKFWATGSGANVKTVNKAHQLSGTTEERETYAANENQQYFDTDLNKMVYYINSTWVDGSGTEV